MAEIVGALSARYGAPLDVVARDVANLLQGLADKRLLRDGPSPFSAPPLSARARGYAPFAGGPAGLLAELTHRCPLQCPYCSNPIELERANVELTAREWGDVFRQRGGDRRAAAASLGGRADRARAISRRSSPLLSTPVSTPI